MIISGASSGIGAAIAIAFAKVGADIAITYRENSEGAQDTAEKVRNEGSKCLVIQADLIDEKLKKQ